MFSKRRKAYSGRPSGSSRYRGPIIIILVLILGFFGYRKYVGFNLHRANDHFRDGDYTVASRYFERAANLPFTSRLGEDGLGVIGLLTHSESVASHFEKILASKPSGFGVDPQLALRKFLSEGRYDTGKQYRDFIMEWKGPERLRDYYLDFAALALGAREVAEARRLLSNVPEPQKASDRFTSLMALTDSYERDGQVPVMVDRHGTVLLMSDLQRGTFEFVVPQLFLGWPSPDENTANPLLENLDDREKLNRIKVTLDIDLQRCAYQALQGHEGAICLLSPSDGQILAAVGTPGINPFDTKFEPGSVIKLLTYAFFLQEGGNTQRYAPREYPSSERIGDRIFYDWTRHGRIETLEEGMAVSCNLMFARMGIDLTWPALRHGLRRIFDGRPYDGCLSRATPGDLQGIPNGDFELGRLAIGLDFLRTTCLGLALIPCVVANEGLLPQPYLLDRFETIEGDAFRIFEPKSTRKILKNTVTTKVLDGMIASVADPRGTGRRAVVPGISLALKTGTAGKRPFDSILVGLITTDRPTLAFCVYLKGAGKAEYEGAAVVANLQEQIKALAPGYLEP